MNDPCTILNANQQSAVRKLADKRGAYFNRPAIMGGMHLSDQEYDHLMHYLQRNDGIDIVPGDDGQFASDFTPTPGILEIIRQLDSGSKNGVSMDVLISWSKPQSHKIA